MERAHDEHRDRGHRLAVRLGADVGGDRHLADVELVAPHHAAERGDDRIDLLEVEHEGLRLDGAVLQRPVVALRAGDGFQLEPRAIGRFLCPCHFSSSRTRNRRTPPSAALYQDGGRSSHTTSATGLNTLKWCRRSSDQNAITVSSGGHPGTAQATSATRTAAVLGQRKPLAHPATHALERLHGGRVRLGERAHDRPRPRGASVSSVQRVVGIRHDGKPCFRRS